MPESEVVQDATMMKPAMRYHQHEKKRSKNQLQQKQQFTSAASALAETAPHKSPVRSPLQNRTNMKHHHYLQQQHQKNQYSKQSQQQDDRKVNPVITHTVDKDASILAAQQEQKAHRKLQQSHLSESLTDTPMSRIPILRPKAEMTTMTLKSPVLQQQSSTTAAQAAKQNADMEKENFDNSSEYNSLEHDNDNDTFVTIHENNSHCVLHSAEKGECEEDSLSSKKLKRCGVIEYPSSESGAVDKDNNLIHRLPSRDVIRCLYEEAMSTAASSTDLTSTNETVDTSTVRRPVSDQVILSDSGLLSFQDVLLPAVAYQEEQVLKYVQSRVKRDHPHLKDTVKACRIILLESTQQARKAVQKVRSERERLEQEREQLEQQRLEQEKQRLLEERKQAKLERKQEYHRRLLEAQNQREMNRLKQLHEKKKKLPANVEVWREIAYLMTEISKLQKEERQWKEANSELDRREQMLREEEERRAADAAENEAKGSGIHNDGVDKGDSAMNGRLEDITKIEQAIEAIHLSSARVQNGLAIVSNIANQADKARKELYQRYRQDYQFQGYQGVKDPKGLIRALSQSQDVDYD